MIPTLGGGTGYVDSTGAPAYGPASAPAPDPAFAMYPSEIDPYGPTFVDPSSYDVPPVQVPTEFNF